MKTVGDLSPVRYISIRKKRRPFPIGTGGHGESMTWSDDRRPRDESAQFTESAPINNSCDYGSYR